MTTESSPIPDDVIFDTRFSSWYVTEEFYAAVARDVATWATPSLGFDWDDERQVIRFLIGEAKLLDQGRLRPWLDLFADDCAYWIATTFPSPDPTTELCTAFDDRRRLEDRVVRLETGTAYSQLPPSRTCRSLSNFEFWNGDSGDELRVRCVFNVTESRLADLRILAGWYGYTLRRTEEGLKIVRKQIDLLEADVHLRNLTLVL
jgi:3-phenylpropionate/cinnamic acid dioxygenase small subunit